VGLGGLQRIEFKDLFVNMHYQEMRNYRYTQIL